MRYVSSIEQFRIEKGMQQGMQQGIVQGVQQGEALALQRLLGKRFGILPADIVARIASASRQEVEGWFDQAIDASRIDDIFGDATPH